jgi:hypothetical protein
LLMQKPALECTYIFFCKVILNGLICLILQTVKIL